MRVLVVGAGGVARELLRRLGESWECILVDPDPGRVDLARAIRPVRWVQGDGSSRVVLRRAGLESADALVACTNRDDVNLEAARIALDHGIQRVVAAAADPERLADYQELGVPVVSPDSLAARRVELTLETRRVQSVSFAQGRAEAIEFRLASDSPACGRALRDLHARSWIVGAILRGDRLIVPHGDTVLEEGDLVTVVGAGADFAEIVRMFSAGEGRFPLDYGKRVAVPAASPRDLDGPVAEAVYVARNSRASSLIVLRRPAVAAPAAGDEPDLPDQVRREAEGLEVRVRDVDPRSGTALASLPGDESVGLMVLDGTGRGLRARQSSRRALELLGTARVPVLLSRGSHPYRTILVPARRTPAGRAAVRAAVDLARFARARLVALAVADPAFLAGEEAETEAQAAIGWVEEEAAVHGVDVEGRLVRGNPVRAFAAAGAEADLMVLGSRGGVVRLFPRIDVALYVVRAARRSVLLVPALPAAAS